MRNAEISIKENKLISMFYKGTLLDYLFNLTIIEANDDETMEIKTKDSEDEIMSIILLLDMHIDIEPDDNFWFDIAYEFTGYKASLYALRRGVFDDEQKLLLLESFEEHYVSFHTNSQVVSFAENLGLSHEIIENRAIEHGDGLLAEKLYPTFQFNDINPDTTDNVDLLAFYYTSKYEGDIYDAILHEIGDELFDFLLENEMLNIEEFPSDFGVALLDNKEVKKFMRYVIIHHTLIDEVRDVYDNDTVREKVLDEINIQYGFDQELLDENIAEAEAFLNEYFPPSHWPISGWPN
jgi:hypothetical protein